MDASGQSADSISGAMNKDHPGKAAPAINRTSSETACAATNKGRICAACEGTVNHSRRRCTVMAKKLNSV